MVRTVVSSVLCIAVLVAAMSFTTSQQCSLTVEFKNYAGNELLKLDSVTYKNSVGQAYTVSMFKYYVGNIELKGENGLKYKQQGYFLINQDEPQSMVLTIHNLPTGLYNAISFTLGVDSMDNCSGAQSGILDPVNGMFWTWNTGYIFLKMEGISVASHSNGKRLEFHIGGYKSPNNCIRRIVMKCKLDIGPGKHNRIVVKADESKLFDAPNPVDFSLLSSVTDFHHACAIADNYSAMFTIMNSGK